MVTTDNTVKVKTIGLQIIFETVLQSLLKVKLKILLLIFENKSELYTFDFSLFDLPTRFEFESRLAFRIENPPCNKWIWVA